MIRLRRSAPAVALCLVALCCLVASARAQATRCNAASAAPSVFVPLPGHPFGVVSSADGCWLFASLLGMDAKSTTGVALLSRAAGKVELKQTFAVAGQPGGLALTHDGRLLVLSTGDRVVFMDVARMTSGRGDPVLGHFSTGENAGSVYVNVTPDDRFLFVSDERAQAVSVVNLQRARAEGFKPSAIVGRIPVGHAPIALTFSPDGRWLYTTSQVAPDSYGWPAECRPEHADPATAQPRFPQGAVIVIAVARAETDPANAVVAKVPAGCNPVRLALAPDGARAYVTARNSNALLAFDTAALRAGDASRALIGTVPTGTAPVGVAVIADGRQIVVTNSNRFSHDPDARQTLTVIDAARVADGAAAILGSVRAGGFPREFGQAPDRRTLFVTNFNTRELQIIDLTRLQPERPTP
ncbi:MAG TPA: hypothetical protein VF546_04745 [Pyrinomonadaceae bacterium]|jgi:DNA-binding beta-propeller fold protein YncE